MFINEIPFVMTVSFAIHIGTAELIKNKKAMPMATSIKQVVKAYDLVRDGQSEHIRRAMAVTRINPNTMSREEHIPAIEQHIRTVKERLWVIANELPFDIHTGLFSKWHIMSCSGSTVPSQACSTTHYEFSDNCDRVTYRI